jgi:uncharacterized membrane protein
MVSEQAFDAARRIKTAGARTALAAIIGLAGGAIASAFVVWQAAILLGWAAAAISFLLWTWVTIHDLDAGDTKRHATIEDSSRRLSEGIVIVAGVALLTAVGLLLVHAGQVHGGTKAYLIAIGVVSVALSWATIHTIFTLRYARIYYQSPVGGIDFNEDDPPGYIDFAYLAFTIGMTFQVSDTDLTIKPIRRMALHHALLSFLFGAVIVALSINVVASLLQ